MKAGQRQRVFGVAGIGAVIVFLVIGLVLGSWQVLVMTGLLGTISVFAVTGRGATLESWSARLQESWLGVALSAGSAMASWIFAVVVGSPPAYGVAVVLTALALETVTRMIRHNR